jgi:hypothetical protein
MMVLSMLCGVLARLGRDAWSRDLHFTAQIAIGYLHINYPRHFRITKRTVLIWNNVTLVFSSIILAPDMAHARSLYLFSKYIFHADQVTAMTNNFRCTVLIFQHFLHLSFLVTRQCLTPSTFSPSSTQLFIQRRHIAHYLNLISSITLIVSLIFHHIYTPYSSTRLSLAPRFVHYL